MPVKTKAVRDAAGTIQTSPSTVICPCADLTLGELAALATGEGAADFDRLLERTGAGKTCTACLLDLEYYFASCRATVSVPVESARDGAPRQPDSGVRLKSRLFGALDRLLPQVAVTKTEWVPVLAGERVEQHLLVANHSLLYKKSAAATIRVGILVRDAEGVERHRESRDLQEGDILKVNLSQYLPKPSASRNSHGLGIGSAMISRKALRPGMWGTTRPQIEIVTPGTACVVHSQGPNGQREQWFTCLHRPGQERIFYSIVNVWNRPLQVEATCYLGGDGTAMRETACARFTIPAAGTRFCEVSVPADQRESSAGTLLYLRWRCSGPRKIHLFCADPSLSRFSIDHL